MPHEVKDGMIRARVPRELKTEVEDIFSRLGLNSSEAINLFYRQVKLHGGLPFPVRIPTEETLSAARETTPASHDTMEKLLADLKL